MNAFIQELFRVGLYKRTQGRVTRQVTFAAIAVTLAFAMYRFSLIMRVSSWPGNWLASWGLPWPAAAQTAVQFGLPVLLLAAGWWITYRSVNLPSFADFLIAVEAEMNKVSWPTRTELIRSSIVVLVTIFILASVLFFFDLFWLKLFVYLGIKS